MEVYKNLNGPSKFVLGVRVGAHLMVPDGSAVVMTAVAANVSYIKQKIIDLIRNILY